MLHDFLVEHSFVQNPADYCVYSRQTENERVYMIIWVDSQTLKSVKEMMGAKFKIKDLDKLEYFLGIDFTQGKVK